ncbi:MAG: hypothetical protein ABI382_09330 [Nakamurella sp.]
MTTSRARRRRNTERSRQSWNSKVVSDLPPEKFSLDIFDGMEAGTIDGRIVLDMAL